MVFTLIYTKVEIIIRSEIMGALLMAGKISLRDVFSAK